MEHEASECVKEQSLKTEVDKAAQSPAYHGIQMDVTCTEGEPEMVELLKREPAFLVKEEVVEDSWQDIAEQQCMQGPLTSAIVGGTNVFDDSADLGNTLSIKEELRATDTGPTVLQLLDTQGTTNQNNISVIKQERTITDNKIEPISCGGKKEIIEDEWRGSLSPQDSLMEQPGTCTALHPFHRERLETSCRVNLRRLDTFQCEVCDAVYIEAHELLQHVQELHGSGTQRALHKHVKSPQISNGGQQCATGSLIPQDSLMVQSDACTALRPFHKERLEASCRVKLMRLVTFQCEVCDAVYIEAHELLQHVQEVHGSGTQRALHNHVKSPQISNGGQQCATGSLWKHVRGVPSEKLCDCVICTTMFKYKKTLKSLVKRLQAQESAVISPFVHTCDYCHKTYTRKQNLVHHMDVVHTKVRYMCSECNKEYKGKRNLQRHVCSKLSIYSCDYCQKMFANRSAIVQHIVAVHSSRSYKCHQCKKIYKSMQYLKVHTAKVHTAGSEPRIYSCDIDYCDIAGDKSEIVQNIAQVQSTRSYNKCHQYKKIFKCKMKYLKLHTAKVHAAGLRTQIYTCDYCQIKFCTKTGLQLHTKRIHVAAHIHRCRRCNKNFKSSVELQQHNKSIHGISQCEVCLTLFANKTLLRQHVKKAHYSKDVQFKLHLRQHEMPDSRLTADVMNAADSISEQQHSVDVVKEEPADGELELGPVVFQHMDCNYRPYNEEPQDDLWGLM